MRGKQLDLSCRMTSSAEASVAAVDFGGRDEEVVGCTSSSTTLRRELRPLLLSASSSASCSAGSAACCRRGGGDSVRAEIEGGLERLVSPLAASRLQVKESATSAPSTRLRQRFARQQHLPAHAQAGARRSAKRRVRALRRRPPRAASLRVAPAFSRRPVAAMAVSNALRCRRTSETSATVLGGFCVL